MSKRYFHQYESPNIVIVPNESLCSSSPKRRKIDNNLTVPIATNTSPETTKLKHKEEITKLKDFKSDEQTDMNETSSRDLTLNTSWASKYLQSIGLDKKSSIWNRKIPRKNISQNDHPKEPPKAEITTSLISISKSGNNGTNPLKVRKKTVSDCNVHEKSNPDSKYFPEVKQHGINVSSKRDNKLKRDSMECWELKKNSYGFTQNSNLKILTCTNDNAIIAPNKIKSNNTKKDVKPKSSKTVSANDGTSRNTDKEILGISKKDLSSETSGTTLKYTSSPLLTNQSAVKSRKHSKVKTNNQVKSVVVKTKYEQNNKRSQSKINKKQSTSGSSKSSASNVSSQKENYENGCSTDELNSIKTVKALKYDANDRNNSPASKKVTLIKKKSKTKLVHETDLNTAKTRKYLSAKESENKSTKETKSPIKRKIPKSYKKIKLVINVIYNKPNSPQRNNNSSNESKNVSTSCTVPNVDLDFLNDFNIDEIVESLDTCEASPIKNVQFDKKNVKYDNKDMENALSDNNNVKSNMCNGNDNVQVDTTDLIKILKGEEDDDLTTMSFENTILKNNSKHSHSIIQNNENKCLLDKLKIDNEYNTQNDHLTMPIKIKEEKLEVSNIIETVFCSEKNNLNNTLLCSNDVVAQSNMACYLKEVYERHDDFTLSVIHNSKSNHDTTCLELAIEKQNNIPVTSNADECTEVNINRNLNLLPKETSNITINKPTTVSGNDGNAEITCQQKLQPLLIEKQIEKEKQSQDDNVTLNEVVSNIKNDNEAKKLTNWKNSQENNKNIIVMNSENSDEQKRLAKNNNSTLEEPNSPVKGGNIAKTDTKDVNNEENDKIKYTKEENYIKKDFKVSEPKNVSENEIMEYKKKYSESDEHTYSTMKYKIDLETIINLEQRLFTCSGSKYSVTEILHTGKYSKIFKCKHPNGKPYALKMLINNKYYLGKEKNKMLNYLVKNIPKDNLFIINVANAFNVAEKWCFLMEYYPKNLRQALFENRKPFPIEQIQDYARQLVMAVMVLRDKDMVHMDIKPEHILINSSNKMLKLCGFDSLCYVKEMKVLPNAGTANYRAPEIILGYKPGFQVDVWATGLVLYEMAANKKLFPGLFNNDILYKQICTLGFVPYDMLKKSKFRSAHFVGTKFMRKTGYRGKEINIISKFYKNNKLCDSIYNAYYENWGHNRPISQQNFDLGKLCLFVKLLQKMLLMHPEFRLPIHFVYANPFIYDAYSYQEW